MRRELICLEPATPAKLELRSRAKPVPRGHEVLVRVEATSVNPIDAKRAAGYGRRLLALKGAGRFPLVLGNDVVGSIEAMGPTATRFALGQRVLGLVATGKAGGAHASHVLVPQTQLIAAPADADAPALAALPYSFTTMWLAVRSTGLTESNAVGRRVLVHGACGALGSLAVRMLASWGACVIGVCDIGKLTQCLATGAQFAVERGPQAIGSLPSDLHVVLNFANWGDDLQLATRLGPGALGQATTVHPLLANFDRLGWIHGGLASRREFGAVRAAVRERGASAVYSWTVFKPDPQALAALEVGLRAHAYALPVGLRVGLDQAGLAFAHVAAGKPGRALLMPFGEPVREEVGGFGRVQAYSGDATLTRLGHARLAR